MLGPHRTRHGSIYVVVLVTIASVAMMVLAGIALRRTDQHASYLHADALHAERGAESGIAYTDLVVRDHDAFMKSAPGGSILDGVALGDASVSVSVLDDDSGGAVGASTDRMVSVSRAEAGGARSIVSRSYEYTSAYHRLALEYGAVAYWPLDESTGEDHADELVQRLEAPFPDPDQAGVFTHGHGNAAPEFSNESEIVVAPHDDAYAVSALTVTLWVRSEGGAGVQGVIAKESPSVDDAPQHAMYFEDGHLHHRLTIHNANYYKELVADRSLFEDRGWHFVAVTIGTEDRMRLYVDGQLVDSNPSGHLGLTFSQFTNRFPWTIGGRRDDAGGAGFLDDNLDGSVARVAVFGDELDEDQIDALMNASSLRDRFSAIGGTRNPGP